MISRDNNNMPVNKLASQKKYKSEAKMEAFTRSYRNKSVSNFENDKQTVKNKRVVDRYGEQRFKYKTNDSKYLEEHQEDVVVKWRGPEYEVYEKSTKWYAVAAFFLVLIIIYAIYSNNPLLVIIFVLISFIGYNYLQTPPRVTDFAVTYEGIIVGNKIYRYDDIDSFWIFYEPPHTRIISLRVHGLFAPYVHIPLHQLDPVDVRDALINFIPEKKQEHTIVDTAERILHM